MDSPTKNRIRDKLQEILDFSKINELWVVGSLADENVDLTPTSDIDIICISPLLTGEVDEFMSPDDDEAQILQNPHEVWGTATEGVELDYTITVPYQDTTVDLQVHLIAQPLGYDVREISGQEIKIYPK